MTTTAPTTPTATGRIRGKEPNHTIEWLRGDRPDRRRRKYSPRRIAILEALAAEPWLTFAELGERFGVLPSAVWQSAQRLVRDGLMREHRPLVDGRPSRCARYSLTEAGRRLTERPPTWNPT